MPDISPAVRPPAPTDNDIRPPARTAVLLARRVDKMPEVASVHMLR